MSPPSTRPSHVPDLAAELIDRIIDFLHDDWRALVACTLTGALSPLTPCAEYHLSNGIDLPISGSQAELLEFVKAFKPGSLLARLVQSIHIHGPRTRSLDATFPVLIDLSHLLNLRAITLSYLFIESNERFIRFLCKIPALQELTCEGLVPKLSPGYRLNRTAGPSVQEKAALCERLTTLRVVDNLPLPGVHAGSPYDSIYQVLQEGAAAGSSIRPRVAVIHIRNAIEWEAWLGLLCRDNCRLESLDLMIDSPLGTSERADDPEELDRSARHLLNSISSSPSLHTLCIGYHPWQLRTGLHALSSEMTPSFLHAISRVLTVLSSTVERHRGRGIGCLGLKSFELVLPAIPSHTRADVDAFLALARSLEPTRWPRLSRVKIAIELMPPFDLHSETVQRWRAFVSSAAAQEAVEGCAAAVRDAFAPLADDAHGRKIEVTVCTQPASGISV